MQDLLQQAWSAIGDYYADRGKWSNAAQYYAKAHEKDYCCTLRVNRVSQKITKVM